MPRHLSAIKTSVALAAALAAGACADDPGFPHYDAQRAGRDYRFDYPTPAVEDLSGRYQLWSKLELPSAGVFPGVESSALGVLGDLSAQPAATMRELADPAVLQAVLDAAPADIRAAIDQRITDYVTARRIGAETLPEYLISVQGDIVGMLGDFDLVSTIGVAHPDDAGNTVANHSLDALVFGFRDGKYTVYVPRAQSLGAASLDVNAVHVLEQAGAIEDARLYLGAHSIELRVGSHAFTALGYALAARHDASDLRGALGRMVDCGGFAEAISSGCTGATCGALAIGAGRMCVTALDGAILELEAHMGSLAIVDLALAGGEAALFDAAEAAGFRDGAIDRIERGHWMAAISQRGNDNAATQIEAEFTGTRIGDYRERGGIPGQLDIEIADELGVDDTTPPSSHGSVEAVDEPWNPPVLGGVEAEDASRTPERRPHGFRFVTSH